MDIVDIKDIMDIMEIMEIMDMMDIMNNCLDGHGWCRFGPSSVRFCPFGDFCSQCYYLDTSRYSVSLIFVKKGLKTIFCCPKGKQKASAKALPRI